MKVQQNGRLFIFWKRLDFFCAFSWCICNKMATLLGVSRAAVSKVMTTYTNHGKISSRRKSGRKPKLSERDRRTFKKTMSKRFIELLQQRWQQNSVFILKTLFAQKLSDESFTDPTSTVELQSLDVWWLEIRNMVRWVVLQVVPNIRPGLCLENVQGSL